jgi:hypothetical protein
MLTVALLATGFALAAKMYWACPLRLLGSDALCVQGAELHTTYRIQYGDGSEQFVDAASLQALASGESVEASSRFRWAGRVFRPDAAAETLLAAYPEIVMVIIHFDLPDAPSGTRQAWYEYVRTRLSGEPRVMVGSFRGEERRGMVL